MFSSLLLVTSLLAALPVNADGLYTKNSPVLQLNPKTYNSLIAKSNHTSVSNLPTLHAQLSN
jgi:protein disulfide-isomerase A6